MAVALAAGGCTQLSVTRVDPDKPAKAVGVRYSLPKTFIQATPQADGTVRFDVVYLPDAENTYAIDVRGFMDTHDLTVTVDDNGLLKQVKLTADTTVVAAKAAEVAGAFTKAEFEQRKKEAEERDKAAAELQKSIDAAQKEVDAAELALANADIELISLEGKYPEPRTDAQKEEIRVARLKRDQAAEALEGKREYLERLRGQANRRRGASGGDDGGGDGGQRALGGGRMARPAFPQVPGATLYAVNEGRENNVWTLKLEAVPQATYETFRSPSQPGPAAITVSEASSRIRPNEALTVKTSRPFHRVAATTVVRAVSAAPGPGLTVQDIRHISETNLFTVTFSGAQAGKYVLNAVLEASRGGREDTISVEFEVIN